MGPGGGARLRPARRAPHPSGAGAVFRGRARPRRRAGRPPAGRAPAHRPARPRGLAAARAPAARRRRLGDRGRRLQERHPRQRRSRSSRAELADGDVIECGGTFLVLRRAPGRSPTFRRPGGPAPALRTFCAGARARARPAAEARPLAGAGAAPRRVGHRQGGRWRAPSTRLSGRGGPLVAVNCGAIPRDAGRERAVRQPARRLLGRRGPRRAWSATPTAAPCSSTRSPSCRPPSQAALLRVLQEGEVQPLGAGQRVAVDVRVVAATNQADRAAGRRRPLPPRPVRAACAATRSRCRRCASPPRGPRPAGRRACCARLEPDGPPRTPAARGGARPVRPPLAAQRARARAGPARGPRGRRRPRDRRRRPGVRARHADRGGHAGPAPVRASAAA